MTGTANIETTLCLIRHGETDWNSSGRLQGREDTPLNELGRKQGEQVAGYLKNFRWDIMVSSPLKRASDTAGIIARHLGINEVIGNDCLLERDYGKASGMLPDERRQRYPDGIFPDQESFDNLKERAFNAVNSIAQTYPGKRIIVVSHGAFINSILYTISGGAFGSFKTRLKNGCLNLLHYSNGQWSVEYYNKTPEDLVNIL